MDKIEKLDFVIPDFLRTIWVSEAAREYWEPKIRAIAASWSAVERLTLLKGMRPGVLQSITPEELPGIQNWALAHNVPIAIVGLDGTTESYGNASIPYDSGKKFTFRVYFGLEPERFLNTWQAGDDLSIGQMLGFPDCCTASFQLHWKEEGWRDLTIHSFGQRDQRNLVYNNVLLRHLGIRGVFHLPCSVGCEQSAQIGSEIIGIMMHVEGMQDPADWLQELLSMPMEWSSLHGVAMVVTPILKTIYASDPLAVKATLRLDSEAYPKEGASGTRFPFQHFRQLRLKKSGDSDFKDNGFGSRASMEEAHKFILTLVPSVSGNVLDLGCGNGKLLKIIKKLHPEATIQGVDTQNVNADGWRFYQENIYDFVWTEQYDLVLMSVERLFECNPEVSIDLLRAIHRHSKYLILSTYNNWMHGFDHVIDQLFLVVTVGLNPSSGYEAKLLERKVNVDSFA